MKMKAICYADLQASVGYYLQCSFGSNWSV